MSYADPVAKYWPEFAQSEKDRVTVAQLLSHQAGLPGFSEPTTVADFYDWDRVCGRLARQAPMWTPGTKNSYHAMTYGFLAGELVRRVVRKSIGCCEWRGNFVLDAAPIFSSASRTRWSRASRRSFRRKPQVDLAAM